MSHVNYGRAGEASACSPSIWKDFPWQECMYQPSRFIHIFDDFVAGRAADASPNGTWELVGTNADLDITEDEYTGVLLFEGSGADNDSSFLRSAAVYDLTMNNRKRMWFEIRLKVPVENADTTLLAGLMEPVGCTAEAVADDGASIIDEDFIGFSAITNATNMGDIRAIYNQGGSGSTVVISSLHSPVSDTYVKLGMRFDGKKTVTFYADGVANGTTLNVDDLTGNSLTNPLAVLFGFKACAAAAQGLEVDWVRFAAEKFPSGI